METGRVKLYLNLVVERNAGKYCCWDIIDDNSSGDSAYMIRGWCDDLFLFENDTWGILPENAECGEQFQIKGPAQMIFTKFWTDCGYEYDMELELDDECSIIPLGEI